MPFNSELHANLGYVDKKYKKLLDTLCERDKRSIKQELEHLIAAAYRQSEYGLSQSITIPNIVVDK